MKKIAIRIGILLAVFVITVVVTTLLLNSENTDNTGDLDEAVLPVAMVEISGNQVNRMYGYTREMQVDFTRDSLTPVDTTREITVAIKPFGAKVEGMSYEVRTSDGSHVVENRTVKTLREEKNYLKADIIFDSDNMLMNQEYTLKLQLDLPDGPAYYYTRIIQRSRLNTDKYIEFVEGFYQKCLNKDGAEELANYLEPDSTTSNNSYTDVNIHSSLDMVTWGELSPQIARKGVPVIKDINETTGSIAVEYQIQAKDAEGNFELYEVQDFYRMRYTQAKVMLLDFQRSAHQVFDGNLPVTDEQGLILGVTPKDVRYVENSSADIVAFVMNGDLWSYSQNASKVTRIFSFRKEESDERYDHGEHDMKILRVDESGDIDFVVYGYMNRGPYEGQVGTASYHYSSSQNAVSQQVFIPSTLSYEFLKRDVEMLSYVSENHQMFLLTEGNLYQIDLLKQSFKVIQEKINNESFVTSSTGARAAWTQGDNINGGTVVTEIDFDTAKTRTIKSSDGRFIKALGYMNEDLIYGRAKSENVLINKNGDTIFAISKIIIEDFQGNIKKDYSKKGMYITQVNVTDALLEMQLSKKDGKTYEYQNTENIMNNKKAVEDNVSLATQYTQRRGYIARLDFQQPTTQLEPVVVLSKVKSTTEDMILDMDIQPQSGEVYYVYAFGQLDGIFSDPAEAILRADSKNGVVLNRAQQYVWERGNVKTQIQLDTAQIPEEVLEGTLDTAALSEDLQDSASVLDLTGCTLEEILYEVSMQRPVVAATSAKDSLVIVGYDEYNTIVYNPKTKETGYMGLQDSTEAFEKAGNRFTTYIDALEE